MLAAGPHLAVKCTVATVRMVQTRSSLGNWAPNSVGQKVGTTFRAPPDTPPQPTLE